MTPNATEEQRLSTQVQLDAERTAAERNETGQFATPSALADQIVSEALRHLPPRTPIRFLDPSIGSGAFFSALLRQVKAGRIADAHGIELDRRFAGAAQELWGEHGLRVTTHDFTTANVTADAPANLLIANPPYVRHHHIGASDKQRLKQRAARRFGVEVSGLAGLYVHFMLLGHDWMSDGGVAAWLIPTEWMSVNYGVALREYLTRHVQLIRLHLFEPSDVQFGDALVSSSVVFFRKAPPSPDARVQITQGGNLGSPHWESNVTVSTLRSRSKWSALVRELIEQREAVEHAVSVSELFRIRRGIATGANPFFIRRLSEWSDLGISTELLRPVLPPARLLDEPVIHARADGYPDLPDPLGLLDTNLTANELEERYPAAWAYLNQPEGRDVRETYLARHREPWYSQEKRPAAQFLCTYMGRGRKGASPFRFFYNESQAIATNGYLLLYPKGALEKQLQNHPEIGPRIAALLQELAADTYRAYGRVYGGGLHKLEPSELASLPADRLADELGIDTPKYNQTELALA